MSPLGELLALASSPAGAGELPSGVAAVLIGVLAVVLIRQDALRAARPGRDGPAVRVLSIAVLPLLLAFAVVVVVQLATILR